MEKVVENKVFNWRPPMFSCIRLWKRQQCCKPKIGGETQVTNKLSSDPSKDQIQYKTISERSIMWYCSHEPLSSSFEMGMASFYDAQSWWTFPLFEAWGTCNEVDIYDTKACQKGSTYVKGENRKTKNRKRRKINCRRKGNWRKRKGIKKKMMEKVVENKVFNQKPPMFSCIRLRKRQQCCKLNIGG